MAGPKHITGDAEELAKLVCEHFGGQTLRGVVVGSDGKMELHFDSRALCLEFTGDVTFIRAAVN